MMNTSLDNDTWVSNADVSTSPRIIGGPNLALIATTEGSAYPEFRQAHARLIAAAPKLLSSCKKLLLAASCARLSQADRAAVAEAEALVAKVDVLLGFGGLSGEFSVDSFDEDDRKIVFAAPMRVEWAVITEKSSPSRLAVEISLPNGMCFPIYLSLDNPHPAGHLDEMTGDGIAAAAKRTLCFEFTHSFFHPHEDPNYNLLNWAIYGAFKGDVTATENPE